MKSYQLQLPHTVLKLETPIVMGILNVTPDSFSDGGQYYTPDQAVRHALHMQQEGAAIIDIGGESTRPGAQSISADEQIRRVAPVIEGIHRLSAIPISIDTTSSKVAQAALQAGASIINDISALTADPAMVHLAASKSVPIVMMHIQGTPQTMQQNPYYENVTDEVMAWLWQRMDFAISNGVKREQIIIDPGIGFGKTLSHNLLLMGQLEQFHALNCPVLVGPSHKSFIGKVLGLDNPAERIWGTAAAVCRCVENGVHIIRVHDVKPMVEVVRMAWAMKSPK